MIGVYFVYAVELLVGMFLIWGVTSYIFLAFWANQWVFNDVIAWSILLITIGSVSGLVYVIHKFVIRKQMSQ